MYMYWGTKDSDIQIFYTELFIGKYHVGVLSKI